MSMIPQVFVESPKSGGRCRLAVVDKANGDASCQPCTCRMHNISMIKGPSARGPYKGTACPSQPATPLIGHTRVDQVRWLAEPRDEPVR